MISNINYTSIHYNFIHVILKLLLPTTISLSNVLKRQIFDHILLHQQPKCIQHHITLTFKFSNELFPDISESQVQYPQQSPERTPPITHQPPNAQFENLSLQLDENHNSDNDQDELQLPNPTLDTQSTDLTVDSNILMVLIRPIENQDITHNKEQDPQYLIQGFSTSSNTTITIPQPPISRNYDPPPLLESDTNTSSSISQQPSSFNNNIIGLISNTRPRFTFQSPSTPERTSVTTHPYTKAQNTSEPNITTTFNINMILTNPSPNTVTSRTLSRPPLQTIPNNPLQYNLSSTNTHNTQHSIHSLEHNAQINPSKTSVQHHNVPIPSSSSIRTNPFFTPTTQVPTNTNNLQTYTSHSNFHITHPYAQPSTTDSTPTYINSSISISEPIKPFDGLDYKYTPEEYLQHIEARVTFSFGLQPSTSHEYKFLHARRMTFVQCSLTGTALSWYIRLNDTYKQDWSAFVQV